MKHKFLLTTLLCATIALTAAPPAKAQVASNPPPVLPETSLDQEKLGVNVLTVMRGASAFASEINLKYNVHQSIFLGFAVDKGTGVDTTLDSAGVFLGVRKAWPTAEIYGDMGIRRDFNFNKWEGFAGLGLAWTPAAQSTSTFLGVQLSHFSIVAEERLVVSDTKTKPVSETLAGVRYSF